jgi:hypothetical protein
MEEGELTPHRSGAAKRPILESRTSMDLVAKLLSE